MADYVASTDKQGIKGLGMEAQREAVAGFMGRKANWPRSSSRSKAGARTTGPSYRLRWPNAGSTAPCWSSPNWTGSFATSILFPG